MTNAGSCLRGRQHSDGHGLWVGSRRISIESDPLGPEAGNDVAVDVAAKMMVNSAARELVLLGNVISYLPSFAIADDIAKGRLRRLLTDHESMPLAIYAMYPHRRHLSVKVGLFIEHLATHYKDMCV